MKYWAPPLLYMALIFVVSSFGATAAAAAEI